MMKRGNKMKKSKLIHRKKKEKNVSRKLREKKIWDVFDCIAAL